MERAHRDLGNRESWEHGHFDIVKSDIPTGVYYCGHIGSGRVNLKGLARSAYATKGRIGESGVGVSSC